MLLSRLHFIILFLLFYLCYSPLNSATIFKEGSFTFPVHHFLNETTFVRYIVPFDTLTGKPLSTASQIVFHAPFNGEEPKIRKAIPTWVTNISKDYGFTVFSLTIVTNQTFVNERELYYIFPEAGWFENIFEIKKKLQNDFHLDDRKLFIVGESSGGSMAQQMISAYPDSIGKAAWIGGKRYAEWTDIPNCEMLALNIWGDHALPNTIEFIHASKYKGIKVRHYIAPPKWVPQIKQFDHHGPGLEHYKLLSFFIGNPVKFESEISKLPPINILGDDPIVWAIPKRHIGYVVFSSQAPKRHQIEILDSCWRAYNMDFIPVFIHDNSSNPEDFKRILKKFYNIPDILPLPLCIMTNSRSVFFPPHAQEPSHTENKSDVQSVLRLFKTYIVNHFQLP
ncbi:MAG: hypothetical protein IKP58_02065 [Victivallales bacterium]|nr:hypothetical protein [Victivallales bacterium]